MKRLVSTLLCTVLIVSMFIIPVEAAELKSFKDVKPSHWAHDAIMEMVETGLFTGTKTPDENGVGVFDPNSTMTQAQFLAVVTRYLYEDELDAMQASPGQKWWENNYQVALAHGIITTAEMSPAYINSGISRQQMAMILVRAASDNGEIIPKGVGLDRIADYYKADNYYRTYVGKCFAMGMIKGYDEKGTFGPKDTLTRAQGALVLYRLINKDARDPEPAIDPVPWGDGTNVQDYVTDRGVNYTQMYADWAANQENITITYGEVRYNRPAVAGDTYIKKDGTKIILELGPSGVVGEGQGGPYDLGLIWGSNKYKEHIVHMNGEFRYDNTANGDNQCGLSSAGAPLMGDTYYINKVTTEGHFGSEWSDIYSNPDYLKYIVGIEGEYDGQISSDPLKLWIWDDVQKDWLHNYAGANYTLHQRLNNNAE